MRTALILRLILAVLLGGLLVACGDGDEPAAVGAGRPSIVATTSVWADVTAAVAGDAATVTALLPVGADPHSHQPSPKDTQRLLDADLIIANGLGLEAELGGLLRQAADDGVSVLEVAPEVHPLAVAGSATPEDEDGGHSHDEGDPHVWLDPVRVAEAVRLIAGALADVPGVDTAVVTANAVAYEREVRSAHERILRLVQEVPTEARLLVSSHDSLRYFADRYGFEVVGTVIEGGATLGATDARHLAELARIVTERDIPAVFTDEGADGDVPVATVADAGQAQVVALFTEGLGPVGSGADTYLGLIETNARRITDALAT